MKLRKRLTRGESKEITRTRLIEAAERIFVRKGFDEASVEDISATAGYTRGAFYSNFEDKEQVFLAVIDKNRPNILRALDEIFQRISEPAERNAAVREWFSSQWRLKDFITLQIEFSRIAMRDRSVRRRLAEHRRRELQAYAASVCRVMAVTDTRVDRPEMVALALLAVIYGIGSIAVATDPECEDVYTEAARLAFDGITTLQVSQVG